MLPPEPLISPEVWRDVERWARELPYGELVVRLEVRDGIVRRAVEEARYRSSVRKDR